MEEEFHFAPALPGENADTCRLFLLHVFPAQVFENETGLADFVFWPCLFETRLQVMLGSSMTEIKGRIEREGMSFISGRSNADRDIGGSSTMLRSPTAWFAIAGTGQIEIVVPIRGHNETFCFSGRYRHHERCKIRC